MGKTEEGKKVWDNENFKWVIVKPDGTRKDLYKAKKKTKKVSKTKKPKTKPKKKKK